MSRWFIRATPFSSTRIKQLGLDKKVKDLVAAHHGAWIDSRLWDFPDLMQERIFSKVTEDVCEDTRRWRNARTSVDFDAAAGVYWFRLQFIYADERAMAA